MTARPILGHFLPIFYYFSKLPGIAIFFAQNYDFLSFETSTFLAQFCSRGNFSFSDNLADFHENTLNITSYHVTEARNGYFRTDI